MQNVLVAVLEVESEGYQAITTLSARPSTDNYTILQMALVKREGNNVKVCDKFDSGITTNDDTLAGGLIGGLVGVLGGPVGSLLMGSYGALAGSVVDSTDEVGSAAMIEKAASKLVDGEFALIVLVEEANEAALDGMLAKYKATVARFDAAVIADEIEEAIRAQEDMERETKLRLRAEKKADRKQKIADRREKMKADFAKFKKKKSE